MSKELNKEITLKYKLKKLIDKELNGPVIIDEKMDNHTYFKTGGSAELFIEPDTVDELKKVLKILKDYRYPYYIVGNGTNLLVSDKGYKGAIVKIGKRLNSIKIDGEHVETGAGTLLSLLAKETCKESLTGLEFASGIPGFVGGAVAMNAGAYHGEMKDIIEYVVCLDKDNNIIRYNNEEMNFRYRNSRVKDEDLIVLKIGLKLKKGNRQEIQDKIDLLTKLRNEKQPINMPSAGSTFKRPAEGYAAKLIEDSGLKGLRFGDAMVSDKHSGFIINCGRATTSDIISLMRIVRERVEEKYSVELEPEVKIIGEEF
jgi:UDP-N-acetylmuramate dehydrogenase